MTWLPSSAIIELLCHRGLERELHTHEWRMSDELIQITFIFFFRVSLMCMGFNCVEPNLKLRTDDVRSVNLSVAGTQTGGGR